MQHPDEGTIHGWLDHALADDDARRVAAHVAECAQCAAAVAEARGLIAAASRLLSSLDATTDVRGAAQEPRVSADGGAGEPRIGAAERASHRVRSGPRAPAPDSAGRPLAPHAGRAASWRGRLGWKARVAALLTVAAGAIAMSELSGPGGGNRAVKADTTVADTTVADTTVADTTVADTTVAKVSAPSVPAAAAASPREKAVVRRPPSHAAPVARPRTPARDAQDLARARSQTTDAMREAGILAETQRSIIRGRVMTTVGQPVAHAAVALQGTKFGTMTNAEGRYALVVPPTLARAKSAVVTVRLIGYQPASKAITLAAADSAPHDFALAPSTLALNEMVVAGVNARGAGVVSADSIDSAADAPPVVRADAQSVAPPRATPMLSATPQRSATRTLTLVSSSTWRDVQGRIVRRSVYELRPGVRVTVDAAGAVATDEQSYTLSRSRAARADHAAVRDTVAAPATMAAGINSIQWTENGTRFTLSGPLPLAELRRVKPLVR